MSRNRNKQNRKRVTPQFKVKTPIPYKPKLDEAWKEFAESFEPDEVYIEPNGQIAEGDYVRVGTGKDAVLAKARYFK